RIKQIGDPLWKSLFNLESTPVDRDVGEKRIANAFVEPSRGRRSVIGERHVLDFAAALFGHLVEQKPVDRAADSKRKDARLRMTLHFGDDLHVVAYVPVSHEANDPDVILRI